MKDIPKYKCHKVVQAFKIFGVTLQRDPDVPYGDVGFLQAYPDENLAIVKVSSEYITKHKPRPGGYYVRYEDGHESWSPAEAFEDSHMLIEE